MIGLLYMHIHALEEEAAFTAGMHMVSSERREKVSSMKNPVSAKLSLAAGILLQLAMKRMGAEGEEIRFGKHGKPIVNSTNVHFNLSHSGSYAVCVYGDLPLGVDIQKIKEQIPKHRARILSPEEEAYLSCSEEAEKRFYSLWARKEAVGKWDGRGLRLPFQSLSFVENGEISDEILFEGKKLYIHEVPLDGYALCICSGKKENEIILEEI